MRAVFESIAPDQASVMRQRMALIASDADLRAAMLGQFSQLVDDVAAALAVRTQRDKSDFSLRNLSGALLGVLMSALLSTASHAEGDFLEIGDRALAHLDRVYHLTDFALCSARFARLRGGEI